MASKEPSTSLKAILQEDTGKKGLAELRSDVSELFQTLSDRALADAVIERLQRYAARQLGGLLSRGAVGRMQIT